MIKRLRCLCERTWLRTIRHIFRFDEWHANAPYACRPYKKMVVDLVNSLHPVTVVEVGCGLGEILSRVNAENRYGLDSDVRVIRAAQFLHPRRIVWIVGSAARLDHRMAAIAFIDCLIMVNWIHNISPNDLAAMLSQFVPKTRYLILDAVDQNAPASYRFKHDFAFLAGAATQLAVLKVPDEPRRFLLFRTLY